MVEKVYHEAITLFHATVLFQYSLKISKNLWLSDVFKGYRKRPVAWNGLTLETVYEYEAISFMNILKYLIRKCADETTKYLFTSFSIKLPLENYRKANKYRK